MKRKKHLKRMLMPIRKNINNGDTLKYYQEVRLDKTLAPTSRIRDHNESLANNYDDLSARHTQKARLIDYSNSLHLKWDPKGPKILDRITEISTNEDNQQSPVAKNQKPTVHNSTLIAKYDKMLESLNRNMKQPRSPIHSICTTKTDSNNNVFAHLSSSCDCVNISTCTPNKSGHGLDNGLIHSVNCSKRLQTNN
jgi:hypothetical protein